MTAFLILALSLALGLGVGLALGALWLARRVSRATGLPVRAVILGGGPTNPTGPV